MSEMTRPGASLATVTASDTTDIAKLNGNYPRALWVGAAGNIAIVAPDSTTKILEAVPAGTLLPIQFKRINSTSTTGQSATSMIAIY
jgi:hypothetical protein